MHSYIYSRTVCIYWDSLQQVFLEGRFVDIFHVAILGRKMCQKRQVHILRLVNILKLCLTMSQCHCKIIELVKHSQNLGNIILGVIVQAYWYKINCFKVRILSLFQYLVTTNAGKLASLWFEFLNLVKILKFGGTSEIW